MAKCKDKLKKWNDKVYNFLTRYPLISLLVVIIITISFVLFWYCISVDKSCSCEPSFSELKSFLDSLGSIGSFLGGIASPILLFLIYRTLVMHRKTYRLQKAETKNLFNDLFRKELYVVKKALDKLYNEYDKYYPYINTKYITDLYEDFFTNVAESKRYIPKNKKEDAKNNILKKVLPIIKTCVDDCEKKIKEQNEEKEKKQFLINTEKDTKQIKKQIEEFNTSIPGLRQQIKELENYNNMLESKIENF